MFNKNIPVVFGRQWWKWGSSGPGLFRHSCPSSCLFHADVALVGVFGRNIRLTVLQLIFPVFQKQCVNRKHENKTSAFRLLGFCWTDQIVGKNVRLDRFYRWSCNSRRFNLQQLFAESFPVCVCWPEKQWVPDKHSFVNISILNRIEWIHKSVWLEMDGFFKSTPWTLLQAGSVSEPEMKRIEQVKSIQLV